MPENTRFTFFTTALISAVALFTASPVSGYELSGYVAGELREFFYSPLISRQQNSNLSISTQPEFYHEWNNSRDSLLFVPFLRLDENDNERTHFDVRELTWLHASDAWELRVGVRKVFWGVTESRHLVDIINQTDLVENVDFEDKLGQPMINLALIQDWGTIDLFVLPGFRERTFPGNRGRLRSIPRVNTGRAVYESSQDDKHVDFAVRWSHTLGDWDIGVAHFYGTSRDPRFLPGLDNSGKPVLVPLYELINQTSLDLQATKGNWLWKLEAIRRSGQGATYFSTAAGFEYTFYGILESPADLGIVVEHLFDDRGRNALTPFEDDIFVGFRLTMNDAQSAEALIGAIVDRDKSTKFYSIEASRRIGDQWKLTLETRLFENVDRKDLLFSFRQDDFLQLELAYYF